MAALVTVTLYACGVGRQGEEQSPTDGLGEIAQPISSTLPKDAELRTTAFLVANRWRSDNPCQAAGQGTCEASMMYGETGGFPTWRSGVLMAGMMDHYLVHTDHAGARAYVYNWATQTQWKVFSASQIQDRHANFHNRTAASYAYLRLAQSGTVPSNALNSSLSNLETMYSVPLYRDAAKTKFIDYKFPQWPSNAESSFSWMAVDAEFVGGLPVWITYGKHLGGADKTNYYTRVLQLHKYQRDNMGLQRNDGLWSRDETYAGNLTLAQGGIAWARGNGWVAAALALALSEMSSTDVGYTEYRNTFVDLMSTVVSKQRTTDGMWNMNALDASNAIDTTGTRGPETSATALFAYALAKGIKRGVLVSSIYSNSLGMAMNGLLEKSVLSDGKLVRCQTEGDSPVPYQTIQNATADYCVGAFLMAAAAAHEL